MKKVAVVILNWNGASLLKTFLPSVCQNTNSDLADIYVADNGSEDQSLMLLETSFPEVKVIPFPVNYGFAQGYNEALKHLEHEYVVLLNSDVEVSINWLEPLLSYAEDHPQIGALQPKIRSLRNRIAFEHAGAAGGYIDKYGFPFCRGRIFDTVEEDRGQYDSTVDIFWASGACLFIRRNLYEKAGGLDPLFFAHMEEIDLCWRIARLGYKIACIPESIVYHQGGATLDMQNPRKVYLNFRNNLLMLYKNLPKAERRSILFKRKLLDGIAALLFLLQGKQQHFFSVLHAHRDARKMIRSHYQHVDFCNDSACSENHFPLQNDSIVLAYYLKRKRFFSQL